MGGGFIDIQRPSWSSACPPLAQTSRRLHLARFIQDGVLRRHGVRLCCAAGSADRKRGQEPPAFVFIFFRLWFDCSAIGIRCVCGVGRERCRFSSVCLTSTGRSVQNATLLTCSVCDSICWNSGGETRRPLRDSHGRFARPHRNSHSDHGFGQFRGSWSDYCEDQGTCRAPGCSKGC